MLQRLPPQPMQRQLDATAIAFATFEVSMKLSFTAAVMLLVLPARLPGQDAEEPPPPPRTATVTAGIGNAMGWLGAQAELYLADERLSAFAGLGYAPAVDPGDPSGITGAAGLRAFTHGIRHRGFLELSVSQVAIETGAEGERLYGPGLQAGYQYAALGGFTLSASVGVGFALGLDADAGDEPVQPLLGLGIGYTWR